MSNVEQSTISCNNETFTRGTYNGISIIKRDSDGFINGTHLCNQFGKRFRKIFENHSWQTYLDTFKARFYSDEEVRRNSGGPIYELKRGMTNDLRGSYIDPRITNYLAFWCSPDYAITVGEIMDKINEYSQATNQTFDETKDQLIAQLQAQINEQQQHIQQLETKIANTSVPEENSDKDLFIIRVGNQLKLCADNTHKPTHFIRRYRFPAAMNVRQMVREHFGLNNCDIPNDSLEDVMNYINELNPKERE